MGHATTYRRHQHLLREDGGDDPRRGPIRDFGSFVKDIYAAKFKSDAQAADRLQESLEAQRQNLDQSSGGSGGFLVPTTTSEMVLAMIAEKSVGISRAFPVEMSGPSHNIPTASHRENTEAGDFASSAGIQRGWIESDTQKPEQNPVFRQTKLVAKELAGFIIVGRSLIADSAPDLVGAILSRLISDDVTNRIDLALIDGDGTGKPLGARQSGALISATRASAGAIGYSDLTGALTSMLPESYGPDRISESLVWLCHPTSYKAILEIEDTNGSLVFVPNATSDRTRRMFNIPLIVTEKVPSLGNAGDVCLFDWSHYLFGTREELSIDISEHEKFSLNQVVIRYSTRVDGHPWIDSTVKLQDAVTEVSPFVQLAA